MIFLSESSVAAAAQAPPAVPGANPLTELPLVGPLVAGADESVMDLGMPLPLAQAVELILLVLGLFFLGRLLVGRVVPWLARLLVGPVVVLIGGLRVLFLLPDLAVARTARRTAARPPVLVYAYGHAVLDGADHLQSAVRTGFPAVAGVTRWSGKVAGLALLAYALYWNGTYCAGLGGQRGCEAPAAQWVSSVKTTLDEPDGQDGPDGPKGAERTEKAGKPSAPKKD
ncbi:hypothetical protein ACFYYH_20155 [Streptomyces sp. NPDC002018]|uniref:hypothetical protein n=1 Tax=Streptomyces sp. NPDC002018 TaxID=3364629 RepID=UPI0036B206CB